MRLGVLNWEEQNWKEQIKLTNPKLKANQFFNFHDTPPQQAIYSLFSHEKKGHDRVTTIVIKPRLAW